MVKSIIPAIAMALWMTGAQAQTPPAPAGAPAVEAPAKAGTAKPSPSKPTKEGIGAWTWNKVSGNWKRMRGAVKEQWGKLTHNEIRASQGRREVLNGYIQSRYGIDREAADRQIDDWLKNLK